MSQLSCPLTSENTSHQSRLSAQHRIHLKAPHVAYKALHNLCAPVPYGPPPMTLTLPPSETIRCQPSDPHHRAAAHLEEERLCCCCCLEPPSKHPQLRFTSLIKKNPFNTHIFKFYWLSNQSCQNLSIMDLSSPNL